MTENTCFMHSDPHFQYISSLQSYKQDLIYDRDTKYNGSWEKLEQKISYLLKNIINELKNYEKTHEIDLGYYLRLYKKNNQ